MWFPKIKKKQKERFLLVNPGELEEYIHHSQYQVYNDSKIAFRMAARDYAIKSKNNNMEVEYSNLYWQTEDEYVRLYIVQR